VGALSPSPECFCGPIACHSIYINLVDVTLAANQKGGGRRRSASGGVAASKAIWLAKLKEAVEVKVSQADWRQFVNHSNPTARKKRGKAEKVEENEKKNWV